MTLYTADNVVLEYRRRLSLSLLIVSLTALLLSGCASPADEKDTFFEEWKAKAESSQPTLPTIPKHQSSIDLDQHSAKDSITKPALAQSKAGQIDRSELPDTMVSVTFIDEELGTVLRALGRIADQNIIINPSVKGLVNTHIVDTPWADVFLGIVNSYGLFFSKEGNLLRVQSVEDLKLQVERESILLEQKQVSPLVNRIVPIEFSNPVEISESIKLLLDKDKEGKPRGSVSVDTHSRSLIIQDSEDNMDSLLAHIDELDSPTPQILIEADIVETNKDTARELGVQWGWMMVEEIKNTGQTRVIHPGGINGGVNEDTGKTGYDPGVYGTNESGVGGQGFGIDLPAAAIGSTNPVSAGFLAFNLAGNLLEMQLSALQKAGKVNILSQPYIATLDNMEANIESGLEVPYQTVDKNGNVVVEYKDAVLRLNVTPHVISNRLVRLDLVTKNDRVDFSNEVRGNPTIIKKLSENTLIVQNGTTVVIAGLSTEVKTNGNIGVPYLKDIPILGHLFGRDSKSQEFEELLVFITPKILGGGREVATLEPAAPSSSDVQQ